jgi:proliferating cell nuclear antigen
MALKAVIKTETLRGALMSMAAINTEAIIDFGPGGMTAKLVDPANVAMVGVHIKPVAFDYFKADTGMMALSVIDLIDMLSGKETISISLDEEVQKLKIENGRMKYAIRLLDPSAIKKPPRIPEIDIAACVSIDSQELKDALKMATKMIDGNDALVFEQGDELFSISTSDKTVDWRADWPLNDVRVRDGMGRSLMEFSYISDITKTLIGPAKIETGLDYPLQISTESNEVSLKFIVAPRLEEA